MLNPKIINVLFKTCEIESFGYGFDNAFKECNNNNVKYEYENTKSGFKFTFYRPLGQTSRTKICPRHVRDRNKGTKRN